MSKLSTVTINDTAVTVKEYNHKRVVTLKEIDQCHGRPSGTARKRFNDNKAHFIEGTDYFKITASEFRTAFGNMDKRQQTDVTLITESGYMMLVKSFTDDLAWNVQRALVNNYFKTDSKTADNNMKLQIQQERAYAMKLNAVTRMLSFLAKHPEMQNLSPIAVQTLGVKAIEDVTGANLGGQLPQTDRTYSATEVGEMLGVSANKIGKTANAFNLKTEENGVWVLDKARGHNKEVSNYRYNDKGVQALRECLK